MNLVCYSANGNTFLMVDNTERSIRDEEKPSFVLANVGDLDGVIFVEEKNGKFFMDYYNRDGSAAAFCGNGARAFAKYLMDCGYEKADAFTFISRVGEVKVVVEDGIWVRMPNVSELKEVRVDDLSGYFVVVGVPHFVLEVENVDEVNVEELGRLLRHKLDANVNFYQRGVDCVKVRTYERGVERETKACGTGVTAVFAVLERLEGVKELKVIVPGGEMFLKRVNEEIFLKGDVRRCSEE